ncbi:MAG: LamG-like jellyroll fold domain-containing protein [Bacteroidota bacterium]|nr:LamG-like jellyroll fold domain-containing protein [Bacteroidota bacterium]
MPDLRRFFSLIFSIFLSLGLFSWPLYSQGDQDLIAKMYFDKNLSVLPGNSGSFAKAEVYNSEHHEYSEGHKGFALNLSSGVKSRFPIMLPVEMPAMNSFTVLLWVNTEKDANLKNVIASNRESEAKAKWGWTISTQTNGSWRWSASDGETEFEYSPTTPRQTINDGIWHQIAFSVNRQKQKVRLYFDGINVAIYHIGEIEDVTEGKSVIIGSDVREEKSEMYSFNGQIDEFALWSRELTDEEIRENFNAQYIQEIPVLPVNHLKMMVWNIWHGGREHGNEVGVQRVIDVIREADPDVIAMIETYGSGPIIADALGYNFYLRSSNLSILSRYPFGEAIDIFKAFNCGGIHIIIEEGKEVAIVNTWLNYLPGFSDEMRIDNLPADVIYENEGETRYAEIMEIMDELQNAMRKSKNVPIILAGDFNSPSHLDFTKNLVEMHWGYQIEWPVTVEIEANGFFDSFREIYPDPQLDYGGTQPSSIFDTFHYRIDYIFYKGKNLKPVSSEVISEHHIKFPSDHNAVITTFEISGNSR